MIMDDSAGGSSSGRKRWRNDGQDDDEYSNTEDGMRARQLRRPSLPEHQHDNRLLHTTGQPHPQSSFTATDMMGGGRMAASEGRMAAGLHASTINEQQHQQGQSQQPQQFGYPSTLPYASLPSIQQYNPRMDPLMMLDRGEPSSRLSLAQQQELAFLQQQQQQQQYQQPSQRFSSQQQPYISQQDLLRREYHEHQPISHLGPSYPTNAGDYLSAPPPPRHTMGQATALTNPNRSASDNFPPPDPATAAAMFQEIDLQQRQAILQEADTRRRLAELEAQKIELEQQQQQRRRQQQQQWMMYPQAPQQQQQHQATASTMNPFSGSGYTEDALRFHLGGQQRPLPSRLDRQLLLEQQRLRQQHQQQHPPPPEPMPAQHLLPPPMQSTQQQPQQSDTYIASMALPSDVNKLTVYQSLLRQSLEYFCATPADVAARVRGRKQKIRLHQIGIRCRYCAHVPLKERHKGAVYYPKSMINVYQAAQNIAAAHFATAQTCCPYLPRAVWQEIEIQKPRRDASKAGRSYWLQACQGMGIYEKDGALWLDSNRTSSSSSSEEEAKKQAAGTKSIEDPQPSPP